MPVCLGVDVVNEECYRGDCLGADDIGGDEVGPILAAQVLLCQRDASIHFDVEPIQRDIHWAEGEGGAETPVNGFFRLKRPAALQDRDGIGGWQGERFYKTPVDKGGGRPAQVALADGRRPEAGADRATQGDARVHLVAGRDLALGGVAEVAEVFVADRPGYQPAAGDVDIEVEITGVAVAAEPAGNISTESLKAVGSDRETLILEAARRPRFGIASLDLEDFLVMLSTEGGRSGWRPRRCRRAS